MTATDIDRDKLLDDLQNEVAEVTALLRDNVEKVLERGERIDKLQARSENLESSSSDFRASTVKLRKKMWWKNCKMATVLGVVIFLFIVIFISTMLVETKPWEPPSSRRNKTLFINDRQQARIFDVVVMTIDRT